ncbi:MAG: hypothetical protein RLZZ182_1307 [Pseudomonadota bacterium]|jgi:hypothetical protein
MNPFDQLVRHAVRQASEPRCSVPDKRMGSTGRILALLSQHGALSTTELAKKAGLDQTRLVWGLMKNPRSSGQVQFQNGMWSLSKGFHGTRIKQAAELLRQHGWVCQPPEGC